MERSKSILVIFVLSLLIFGVSLCNEVIAGEAINAKFAVYSPPHVSYSKMLRWSLDELDKRTNGAIKFKYFFSESLVAARDCPDALKSGLVQSTTFVPAYYPSKLPLYFMGYLPCLLPLTGDSREDWITYFKIINEWLQTEALKNEFSQYKGVLFTEAYPAIYSIMGNIRVAQVEDLKGRKIRAIGGIADLLSAAGAVPIFTTYPEMYEALYKGTIEGVCHAWMDFHTAKIYEKSKYWTQGISLGNMPSALVLNEKTYNALPKAAQNMMRTIRNEYSYHLADEWTEMKKEVLSVFKKEGIEIIKFPDKENQQLKAYAQNIWKTYVEKAEKHGAKAKEAFNSLQDIIKKHVPDHQPYYIQ